MFKWEKEAFCYHFHPWGQSLCLWALAKLCPHCALSEGGWWQAGGALRTNSSPERAAPSHAWKKHHTERKNKKKKKEPLQNFYCRFTVRKYKSCHCRDRLPSEIRADLPTSIRAPSPIQEVSLTLNGRRISSQLPNFSQQSWTRWGASARGTRVARGRRGAEEESPLR